MFDESHGADRGQERDEELPVVPLPRPRSLKPVVAPRALPARPTTIPHAGKLQTLSHHPAYLWPVSERSKERFHRRVSCSYCGLGDSGRVLELKQGLKERAPTMGCIKLKSSMGLRKTLFPIHTMPSVLDSKLGQRKALSYDDAIEEFADRVLEHLEAKARILLYACGQVDYFTIFAIQEIFRILGVRNLGGNAEHCLNSGAVHNEFLTGQEGPFLTVEQSLYGEDRFFLLNGWNGMITHPPAFGQLIQRDELDAYLIEVAETESARAIAEKCGEERVLYIRSGADPHLALAVAHELLSHHKEALEERFVQQYADRESYESFVALASEERFGAEATAERIAPEPDLAPRLVRGIRDIAAKLASSAVPINIPSVGLSQTTGIVAHCLWGSTLALLGKYGLHADGSPAGGVLRLPGQINAQTEVQGLSNHFFMGRIPMTPEGAKRAALRMGLPEDAYDHALHHDAPRVVLDYSDETEEKELFICLGTQFESSMMERDRWLRKLIDPSTRLVVIDPIPDPFAEDHAELLIPSPPHSAASKLYQNGEWRFTLSSPMRQAAPETRTDATILYDMMAAVSRKLREDPALLERHPRLRRFVEDGTLQQRFEPTEDGGGLLRIEGEVCRPQLWRRVQSYMSGEACGSGPLYCRPEHDDGEPITWRDLVESGQLIYGGVGTTRYRLDYDDPHHVPFRDIYRNPGAFRFFTPTESDLELPEGIILNSGRSTLSDDEKRIRYAISTFNTGKHTPASHMPQENPLFISHELADELLLDEGELARVVNVETGAMLVLPVVPTSRVKGKGTYISFHKCKEELKQRRYLNELTSRKGRCPYSNQTNMKTTQIRIEKIFEAYIFA